MQINSIKLFFAENRNRQKKSLCQKTGVIFSRISLLRGKKVAAKITHV